MNLLFREEYFESAVMLCIAKINNVDYLILEKRAENIRQGGEISFPGGKKDKSDLDFKETAIRETVEELGIDRSKIKNTEYFGTLVSRTGVLLECFISKLDIEKFEDLNFNKNEVEKLLFVPIKYFLETEPIVEKIKIQNIPYTDIRKYNFPERYYTDWTLPDRIIYIYIFDEETVWGMTAEIIVDFVKKLTLDKKVAFYELEESDIDEEEIKL